MHLAPWHLLTSFRMLYFRVLTVCRVCVAFSLADRRSGARGKEPIRRRATLAAKSKIRYYAALQTDGENGYSKGGQITRCAGENEKGDARRRPYHDPACPDRRFIQFSCIHPLPGNCLFKAYTDDIMLYGKTDCI